MIMPCDGVSDLCQGTTCTPGCNCAWRVCQEREDSYWGTDWPKVPPECCGNVCLYCAPAGSIILTRIEGFVGFLVWLLQALNGDLSHWTHVAVTLDDDTLFESQPGGAVISPKSKYVGRPAAVVPWEMDDAARAGIVAHARTHEGTGYNWHTYLYLAVYRLRLPILTRVLRRRVENSELMICSQAADHLYREAGQQLFDDHRLPFDLTPGDYRKLL